MPSTQCAECGHALTPAARFCSACGCAVGRRACGACGAPADAGARFCTQCGGPQAPALIPQRPLIEQRQATVVNFDIVNYTELTARLDPQDLSDAVAATFGAIRRIVYEHKGDPQAPAAGPGMLADRVIGDSLMFLFGYPTASDDDAERATRAAFLAATAVSRLEAVPGVALQVRVGVATGVVVVGVKEDGGPGAEPVVTGPAPNLAARLRELAAPGGVVIADTTWRLVANYFRCDDLGPVALKGIGTEHAWQLLAPKRGGYRFGTRELAGLTPLVGRKHELGLLLDRWALAREGRGQAVLVSGEPGVGKSRILSEFEMSWQPDRFRVLRFQCTPYHRNSAFHPIVENLLRDLNLDAEDAAGVRREQLEEVLVGTLGLRAEDAAAIGSVLVSPSAGAAPAVVVSQQERRRAIDALVFMAQLTVTRSPPVLIVFEDAQWADPSTIEVMDALLARIGSMAALLIVTHRPEFDAAAWTGAHVARLELMRLDRPQCEAMIERLDTERRLPPTMIRHILDKTDCVPLFVEEFTKAILEAQVTGGAAPLVPVTLRDSLAARLDRSLFAKAVAQVGAIIGREFPDALLRAVMTESPSVVDRGLADLQGAGLLFTQTTLAGTSHHFKHALVQDVVRDSLLRDARQGLHGRVALALEAQAGGSRKVEPEILAFHFTEAAEPARAVRYWALAGSQAAQRAANIEAIHHYQAGLRAVEQCPEGAERVRNQIDLLSDLLRVQVAATGYGSPAVAQTLQQISRLIGKGNGDTSIFRVRWVEGELFIVRARYDQGLARGQELVRDAEERQHADDSALAHTQVGLAHLYRGEFPLARQHLEMSLGVSDAMPFSGALRPSEESGVWGLAYLARTLWFLGRPALALQRSGEACDVAQRAGNPLLATQAAGMRMLVLQLQGDRDQLRLGIDRARAEAERKDTPYWKHLAEIVDAWWRARELGVDTAGDLQAATDSYRATGARLGFSAFRLLLAETQTWSGRHDDALRSLTEALAFCAETGEGYFLAELHRRRGCVLLAAGGADARDPAEAAFLQALDVARRQEAIAWQLRSAVSLGQLWIEAGKKAEAEALLRDAHGRLTEGHDAADAIAARALLTGLGADPSAGEGTNLFHQA